MRVRSTGTNATTGAQSTSATKETGKADSTKFSGLVEGTKDATDEKPRQSRSAMLKELELLARDVESGKASKEEVSRKFVHLVIRDRFGDQSGKGVTKMEESIGKMVEDDPNFVGRLQSQLKKLAKT